MQLNIMPHTYRAKFLEQNKTYFISKFATFLYNNFTNLFTLLKFSKPEYEDTRTLKNPLKMFSKNKDKVQTLPQSDLEYFYNSTKAYLLDALIMELYKKFSVSTKSINITEDKRKQISTFHIVVNITESALLPLRHGNFIIKEAYTIDTRELKIEIIDKNRQYIATTNENFLYTITDRKIDEYASIISCSNCNLLKDKIREYADKVSTHNSKSLENILAKVKDLAEKETISEDDYKSFVSTSIQQVQSVRLSILFKPETKICASILTLNNDVLEYYCA